MFKDAVLVGRNCPFCGEYHEVLVSEADYYNWQNGEYAQNAFPYLSAEEREILISGICSTCWEKMFPAQEEEDEPYENEDWEDWEDEPDDLEQGFNPYSGDYDFDC